MEDTPEPRWRRRKEARRPEIITAAFALFAERGYAATRLEEVAKRAGVSKGTLYLYFDSKEDLFKSLVSDTLIANISELEKVVETHTGPMISIIDEMISIIANRILMSPAAMMPKLMIAEATNFPDLAKFYVEEVIQRMLRILARIVARGVARGEFRPLPIEVVGPVFIGPILLASIWRSAFAPVATMELDIDRIVANHPQTMRRILLKDEGAGS